MELTDAAQQDTAFLQGVFSLVAITGTFSGFVNTNRAYASASDKMSGIAWQICKYFVVGAGDMPMSLWT